jgi:hypothetical protein
MSIASQILQHAAILTYHEEGYNMALNEFMEWFQREPRPGFTKATVSAKNFFDLAHGQSPGWQADPPFRGEAACHCVVQRRSACGNHSGEAEHDSGIGLKLFGFIPEPAFTFIPESCSGSSRNTVRNHPGIAFILPRIPHMCLNAARLPTRVDASGNLHARAVHPEATHMPQNDHLGLYCSVSNDQGRQKGSFS